MAKNLTDERDEYVDRIRAALEQLERDRPGAEASLYRALPGVIKARVVDDRFAGVDHYARHDDVFAYLRDHLDEDTMQELYILVLVAPDEMARSIANIDFEDSVPSDRATAGAAP